ncbi:Lsr2 dimerization domain-containing protein [Kocuria nitroreducens]|uniref:Lsr2 dimerization domain-containing protein n=1 Tax=Kocuria nitroreducens TaxID=3058914 RepID=UPI0036DBCCBF
MPTPVKRKCHLRRRLRPPATPSDHKHPSRRRKERRPWPRKGHVHLEDDLNCGPTAETVTFALDGQNYPIDLPTAEKVREPLHSHAAASRKTTRHP